MKQFFLLTALLFSTTLFSQNKIAMIVAVGEYAPANLIPPIASVNDVKYIKAILNKNGFTDKNILTLINAKATKAAILKGLADLATKAKKKDIVVLHFACHGQQIRDQRTVELGKDEDDGYDEALLPYDAKARYNPTGYKGEKHLRDDDLYPRLLAIRQKIGPEGSLLVLIDACHSGTGTRAEGFAITRGDPVPFPDPENPIDSVINLAAAEARQGFFEAMPDSISNMVVISGSAPHQENKQLVINHEELGSLSYSFYKAMSDMPPGNNYALLFEKIKATIQAYIPDQVPVIEGNAQQVIFSGKYTAKQDRTFIRVGIKALPAKDDSLFTVEKGMMDNMMPGAVCSIYEAGSKEPFTTAVIRKVDNFKSIGIAGKLLRRSDLYELKQEEENYGNLGAGLALKFEEPSLRSSRLVAQVKQFLQPYRFLSLADNADFQLAIRREADSKKAELTDRSNTLLWSANITGGDSLSAADQQNLIRNIKKAMRVKYLRTMP
ncbi:MAG: caspase family protein, partial [Chitinophagaceae bacterium]|nr:caspase family protein [Chitinophagaceae bacterium]